MTQFADLPTYTAWLLYKAAGGTHGDLKHDGLYPETKLFGDLHDAGVAAENRLTLLESGSSPKPSVKDHGGACDLVRMVAGAITTGTKALTVTSVTGAVAGQNIHVPGAGAAGADLLTTIDSINVGTNTITIHVNASTTVTAKVVHAFTDDTTAILNTLAAVIAQNPRGGTMIVPAACGCLGTLPNFNQTLNITVEGLGNNTGDAFTHTGGGTTTQLAPSAIVYFGTGSSTFLDARQTHGFTLRDLDLRYANAGYTGNLLDATGATAANTNTGPNTNGLQLENVTIGSAIDGLTGCVLVTDTYNWWPSYRNVNFLGGDIQVLCANSGFVNGRSFVNCTWGHYGTVAVRNLSEGTSFHGGVVERTYDPSTSANRLGKFIDSGNNTVPLDGGGMYGTWFSDVNNAAAANAWISLGVSNAATPGEGGFVISGCRMGGGTNQTFLKLVTNWVRGISIQGGSAPNNGTLVDCNSKTECRIKIALGSIWQGTGLTVLVNVSLPTTRVSGVWQSYTATLGASTTNPTMGTGGAAANAGRFYINDDGTVSFVTIQRFGSSGFNAGSGNWFWAIPIKADVSLGGSFAIKIGHASLGVGLTHHEGSVHMTDGTGVGMTEDGLHCYVAPEGGLIVTNSTYAWGAGDNAHLQGQYQPVA